MRAESAAVIYETPLKIHLFSVCKSVMGGGEGGEKASILLSSLPLPTPSS